MKFHEEEFANFVKPYILRCRPGDWQHAKRVVKWVKQIGADSKDINTIIKAAYIHDIGWKDLVEPNKKLTKKQLLHLEPTANTNTEKNTRKILEKKYPETEIQTILKLISAADAHESNDRNEAIIVDADNLSKLDINHLKEKYQERVWIEWQETWKKTFPNRIKTEMGKKVYPKLLKKLKSDIEQEIGYKTKSSTHIIKSNQDKDIHIKKSGDYTIKLVGEGAHVNIKGLFKLAGTDKLSIDLTIIHAAPHTSADTNLRAVVDDSAAASINGTIIVQKNAQQTNSFLNENVLLLSKTAQAHAIPNLEIEADDVKCSHAATVATIDDEQLFYLQSRGIPKKKAKTIIADGFLKK